MGHFRIVRALLAEKVPAFGRKVVREGRTRSQFSGTWTKPYVAARREKPAVLAHDDGRLALLHPIRLMATCLVCHGDEKAIAPEVHAVLAKEYPSDQATGFQENDLRGWFWVEVPKP